MLLPSTGPHSVRVNRWNREDSCLLVVYFVFASWLSTSTIPGGIAGDTPTQCWKPPFRNRTESQSRFVQGSTSSCGIAAEVSQWLASTTKMWGLSQNDSKWIDQPQRRERCVNVSLSEAHGWSECKYPWTRYCSLILPS